MGRGGQSRGDLAAFADQLVAASRRETLALLPYARAAEDKGEHGVFDPVTAADRACEAALRALIEARFPEDGVTGEEFPDKVGKCSFVWSIDPIDGTRSYICGLPTWTTLIALLEDSRPVFGLIDAPCLDETYMGLGDQATMIRKGEAVRLSTSGCSRIAEARFSTTDPFLFGSATTFLLPVLRAVKVTRYGHDGYAYARLAAGSIDLVIENGLKAHDYNALIPVVRAAGGHFGDWSGGSDFSEGNVVAAATRELYDAAVELLGLA